MIITIHLTKIVVRLCQGSMCFSLTIQDGITAVDAASLGEHADVVDILMKARADANPMVQYKSKKVNRSNLTCKVTYTLVTIE